MKKMVILVFSLIAYSGLLSKEKIKVYSFYTPSHKVLVDEWFLPSISQFSDEVELTLKCFEQVCHSGSYHSEGWIKTMMFKIDLIIEAIEENMGDVFIHADVDIQFFKPFRDIILERMKDNDLLIQRDDPNPGTTCAGFFACRANKKTLALWKSIKRLLEKEPKHDDQEYLNYLLRKDNLFKIKWDYLPSTFMSGGTLTGCLWKPGKPLPVPHDIVLHHANWALGMEHKIEQLSFVSTTVKKYYRHISDL